MLQHFLLKDITCQVYSSAQKSVKKLQVAKPCDIENSNTGDQVVTQFDRISDCFATLNGLLECIKSGALQTQTSLIAVFKISEKIINAFLKRGMPLMDKFFASNFEQIHLLLKAVQKPTRVLQRMCSHAKDDKRDDRVTALVPALKRCLETLVRMHIGCRVHVRSTAGIDVSSRAHSCDFNGEFALVRLLL